MQDMAPFHCSRYIKSLVGKFTLLQQGCPYLKIFKGDDFVQEGCTTL